MAHDHIWAEFNKKNFYHSFTVHFYRIACVPQKQDVLGFSQFHQISPLGRAKFAHQTDEVTCLHQLEPRQIESGN